MDRETFVDAFLRWKAAEDFEKRHYSVDSPKELFNDEDWRDDALNDFFSGYPSSGRLVLEDGSSGQFEVVNTEGGMDQGSHAETTWHLPAKDVYYTIEGSYASHYGYDWDDAEFYESKPEQKMTTVWVKK